MPRCSPAHGPHARQQFLESEWFGEVIIRAAVETADAILDLAARGEHEDGLGEMGGTRGAADAWPVALGQHPVNDK